MGREIRRVPANWEHPKQYNIHTQTQSYIPLIQKDFDDVFKTFCAELDDYRREYEEGKNGKMYEFEGKKLTFFEYYGNPPVPPKQEDLMPTGDWYQLYENVSEGTPLSPPFATQKELIDWLSNNKDFWGNIWSPSSAKRIVEDGFAFSGIISNGRLYRPHEML